MVRPLRELAAGMESVGRGELHGLPPLTAHDRDEIGQVVDTFNRMAAELAEKKSSSRRWPPAKSSPRWAASPPASPMR